MRSDRSTQSSLTKQGRQFLAILLGREPVEQEIKRIIRVEQNIGVQLNDALVLISVVPVDKVVDPKLEHGEQKVDVRIEEHEEYLAILFELGQVYLLVCLVARISQLFAVFHVDLLYFEHDYD